MNGPVRLGLKWVSFVCLAGATAYMLAMYVHGRKLDVTCVIAPRWRRRSNRLEQQSALPLLGAAYRGGFKSHI
jgi:hypothetical protein